ncbi:hypothetical protein FQZ97_810200 [compost metagenome]
MGAAPGPPRRARRHPVPGPGAGQPVVRARLHRRRRPDPLCHAPRQPVRAEPPAAPGGGRRDLRDDRARPPRARARPALGHPPPRDLPRPARRPRPGPHRTGKGRRGPASPGDPAAPARPAVRPVATQPPAVLQADAGACEPHHRQRAAGGRPEQHPHRPAVRVGRPLCRRHRQLRPRAAGALAALRRPALPARRARPHPAGSAARPGRVRLLAAVAGGRLPALAQPQGGRGRTRRAHRLAAADAAGGADAQERRARPVPARSLGQRGPGEPHAAPPPAPALRHRVARDGGPARDLA